MTPDQRIDKNIGDFLRDAGLLGHYRAVVECEPAREAMRRIMSESYIAGVNSAEDALSHVLSLRKEARK